MSLLYTHEMKKNPQNKDAEPKIYLASRSRGRMDMEELLDMACKDSTIDPYEVRLALHRLFNKTIECLALGFTVHYDEFGYFFIYLQSESSDSIEEATVEKIKNKRVAFYPSPKFRSRVQNIKMERMSREK